MSRTTLRNVAIIALVAFAVAAIPGGSATAETILAIISLMFVGGQINGILSTIGAAL